VNGRASKTGRWLAVLLLCVAASGCVTTETGGFASKKDPKKAAELSVQAARNYIRDRNWDAARRHLRTALEIDGSNGEAHESLAQVFWMTGEIEQADVHFKRAVSLDSKNSRVRNNYAAYLYQQNRYKDAEVQLEAVADDLLYDKRAGAFHNLGKVRIKLKDYAGARTALERSLMMERDNPAAVLELAEVNFRQGEFARSQELFNAFRKGVKQQTPASLWLGVRLADKFGDRDAKASYALALRNLYPRSEEYLEYVSVYGNGNDGTQ
jgi:type IV pilus assembly protein PilF